MISQFVKVDDATWKKMTAAGQGSLLEIERECDLRVLKFHPQLFTHVYSLLGQNPARSGYDLSYYLATVNGFLDRNEGVHQLRLIGLATDVRKRLSEDLAVAVSALFMNGCFGVDWRSMAHIPVNNSLSRKRPDFEGFSGVERHLWESKGVSSLGSVVKTLGKAMGQVKGYPESSLSKLAIVSYFSDDPRLFESSTFVVDPEMPDVVPPDRTTAELLHVEHVLHFAGLPKTASVYLKALAKYLRAQGQIGESGVRYRGVPYADDRSTRLALEGERGRLQEREVRGRKYMGRRVSSRVDGAEVVLWLGVRSDLLDVVTSIPALARFVDENDGATSVGDGISILDDATVLIRQRD